MGEIEYKYSIGDTVTLLNGWDIEEELEMAGVDRDNVSFTDEMYELIGHEGTIVDTGSYDNYPTYTIEFEDGTTWYVNEEWIEPIQRFDQSNPELDSLFEV